MDPAVAVPPRKRRLLVPLALVAAAAAALWWAFRDRDEPGVVAGMRWSHTTQLERWQDVSRSGWRHDLVFTAGVPPVRGAGERAAVLITNCKPRLLREETYVCGTETVTDRETYACGTEKKCKKTRRGRTRDRDRDRDKDAAEECEEVPRKCTRPVTREREKRCTREVHADWCEYLTQEWVPVRSERIEGDGHLGLRFPEIPPANDSERVQTSASYTITVNYDGGQQTAVVPRSEYDQWRTGDAVVVQVETVGGVLGLRRPTPATPVR